MSIAVEKMEEPVLMITRVVDAPREVVFQMFTEPQHLVRFWGSPGCTSPVCEMDVRPGGLWRHVLRTPDGTEYPSTSEYMEVKAPERLVYKWAADPSPSYGKMLPPGHVNTITFEADGEKTKVTLATRLQSVTERDELAKSGFASSIERSLTRLEDHLGATSREIAITRLFDAPQERVFAAWTDPKHVASWWGPRGFTTTISEMDVRPGGTWRLVMHGPDGRQYKNRIVFSEVVKPEKLVYKHSPEPGSEPVNFETTVTFEKKGAKTEVTLRMVFPTAEARDYVARTYGAIEGGKQTLGRLREHLEQDLVLTRVFEAPRETVFKMWTDVKHLQRWWGPKNFTNPRCEWDARPGGAIRIDMKGPDGTVYPMSGVIQEVVEPEKLVFKSAALDAEGNAMFEILNTVLFSAQGEKTSITLQAKVVKTTPVAPQYLAGMSEGWSQSLDRLAEECKTA